MGTSGHEHGLSSAFRPHSITLGTRVPRTHDRSALETVSRTHSSELRHERPSNMAENTQALAKESLRKVTKPLIEKRRRARINDCLNQLKTLVLEAMNKDTTRHSKLEKADILDMTVQHLKSLHRQYMKVSVGTDPNFLLNYQSGYKQCIKETEKFLNIVNGVNTAIKSNVLSHLENCMQGIDMAVQQISSSSTQRAVILAQHSRMLSQNPQGVSIQHLQLQLPVMEPASCIPAHRLQSNAMAPVNSVSSPQTVIFKTDGSQELANFISNVRVIQETGEIAVVLPGQAQPIPVIPLYSGPQLEVSHGETKPFTKKAVDRVPRRRSEVATASGPPSTYQADINNKVVSQLPWLRHHKTNPANENMGEIPNSVPAVGRPCTKVDKNASKPEYAPERSAKAAAPSAAMEDVWRPW